MDGQCKINQVEKDSKQLIVPNNICLFQEEMSKRNTRTNKDEAIEIFRYLPRNFKDKKFIPLCGTLIQMIVSRNRRLDTFSSCTLREKLLLI